MTVLRSREIVPRVVTPQSQPKTLTMEPTTPDKTLDPSNLASPTSTPSTHHTPAPLGLGLHSFSVSNPRRSLRLASIRSPDGINPAASVSVSVSGSKRKSFVAESGVKYENDYGLESGGRGSEGVGEYRVFDSGVRKVRVSDKGRNEVLSMVDDVKASVIGSPCDFTSFRQVNRRGVSDEKGGGKQRVSGNGLDLTASVLVSEDWRDYGFLNLRSGKKVSTRRMEGSSGDVGSLHVNGTGVLDVVIGEGEMVNKYGMSIGNVLDKDQTNAENRLGIKAQTRLSTKEKGKGKVVRDDLVSSDNAVFDTCSLVENVGLNVLKDPTADGNPTDKSRWRLSREEKGNGIVIDDLVSSHKVVLDSGDLAEKVGLKEVEKDRTADGNPTDKSRRRLSREEKGKGKAVEDGLLSNGIAAVKLDREPKAGDSATKAVSGTLSLADDVSVQVVRQVKENNTNANVKLGRGHKERFRDIAKKNASRFAHFSSQEIGENRVTDEAERELPGTEADGEVEDWPGPFSTAMKIIKDRENNVNVLWKNSGLDKSKPSSVLWVPKKDQGRDSSKLLIPSLKDLCLSILAKNADAITSLHSVPDIMRHKLSQLLCDSRRMNNHFLELLVHGSPSDVRITNCTYFTEEQFTSAFEGCETNNLTVVQLDLCGCCMPDYVLNATLARSSNSLPVLTMISLKGAYRLSDAGLRTLVASAPALRSINLSECSLLTSDGIHAIADSLGLLLRELYIDDCQNIDAMLILPALSKLEHLEVLSIAGIETVCDDFLGKFIAVCGQHIKELTLAKCMKLTDSSLKVIAENCTGLCALDLGNLHRLTDSTMGYLANGCRGIQTLKLCRNSFSDEAVAAYLEASGESLKELSLYSVKKVSHNTAVSLARCSRKLLSLDLSWCRNLTDETVGLIVDSCLSLKMLKLFGCTQITNLFLDGHSNLEVQIIWDMPSTLEHLKVPDPLEGPLHYSSVSS